MKLNIELDSIEELAQLLPLVMAAKKLTSVEQSIDTMALDVRTMNCLKAENISTIQRLVEFSANDLLKTPNLGRTSLEAIRRELGHMGMALRGEKA